MGSWRAFSNLSTALSANLVLYSTSHSLYSLQFVFTQSSLWPSLKPGSPLKRTHSPEAPSRGDGSFSLTPRAYTGRRALPSLCTPVLHPHHYSQGGEKNLSSFGDDANLIYCLHLSPLLSLPKYTHAGFTEGVVPWILLSPGVFNVYCKVFSN